LLKLNKNLIVFDFKNIFFNRNLVVYPLAKFEEILSSENFFVNNLKAKLFLTEFSKNDFVKQSNIQLIKMPVTISGFLIYKYFIYKMYFIFIINFFLFKKLMILLIIFFFKYFLFKFFKNFKLKKAKIGEKGFNFDIFFNKYIFNYFFYYEKLNKMFVLCLFIKMSQLGIRNFYRKA